MCGVHSVDDSKPISFGRRVSTETDIHRPWPSKDHRVRAWRRGQQKKALCVARLEDEHLSDWWKAEGENMMELEAKRRRDHIQLAESHERLLAELEHERTTVRLRNTVWSLSRAKMWLQHHTLYATLWR